MISFEFLGQEVNERVRSDGFFVEHAVKTAEIEQGEPVPGKQIVYKRGFAWHYFTKRHFGEHKPVTRMVFVDEADGEVHVFVNGRSVGHGRKVRLEVADRCEIPSIRVGGRAVAVYASGAWRQISRDGALREQGVISVGPADLHTRPWEKRVRPGVRLRVSGISERVLIAA